MRIKRNPPGSVIKQSLFFTEREIERMCTEALKSSGFMPSSPGPIDIETFIEKHFQTNLDYSSELGQGVLGWTLFGPKGQIAMVGIDPSISNDASVIGQRRCRATAAHEAGHCLMHPILFLDDGMGSLTENLDFEQRRILCRKEDFLGRYDGRWWEVQANKAIGGFLLPSQLVRDSLTGFLVQTGSLGLQQLPARSRSEAAHHVSEIFDVNLTPAQIRVELLFPPCTDEFL